jgi:hypothetical protein
LLLAQEDWVAALGVSRGLAAAAAVPARTHTHADAATGADAVTGAVPASLASLHFLLLGKLLWWLYQDPPIDPHAWVRALQPVTEAAATALSPAAAPVTGLAAAIRAAVSPPAPAAVLAAALRCLAAARAGLATSHGASHALVAEASRLAAEAKAEADRASACRGKSR